MQPIVTLPMNDAKNILIELLLVPEEQRFSRWHEAKDVLARAIDDAEPLALVDDDSDVFSLIGGMPEDD